MILRWIALLGIVGSTACNCELPFQLITPYGSYTIDLLYRMLPITGSVLHAATVLCAIFSHYSQLMQPPSFVNHPPAQIVDPTCLPCLFPSSLLFFYIMGHFSFQRSTPPTVDSTILFNHDAVVMIGFLRSSSPPMRTSQADI